MNKVKISRSQTRPLNFKWKDEKYEHTYYIFKTSEWIQRHNKDRYQLWKACYKAVKITNSIGLYPDVKFEAGFFLKK